MFLEILDVQYKWNLDMNEDVSATIRHGAEPDTLRLCRYQRHWLGVDSILQRSIHSPR